MSRYATARIVAEHHPPIVSREAAAINNEKVPRFPGARTLGSRRLPSIPPAEKKVTV